MKHLITLMLFFVAFPFVLSQTSEQIQKEAYPDGPVVIDNSPYAQLWRQVVEAKKSGNEELHKSLLQQLHSQHPDYIHSRPSDFNAPRATDQQPLPPFTSNQGDWGPGDVRIFLGDVYTGGTNNTAGGNPRSVRYRVDSLGNKYMGFIRSTRDTLYIFKSTNDGLDWTRLQRITPGGTNLWHSFDFFVTDTTGGFKIGFAAAVVPDAASHEGTLYFFSMNENGGQFFVSQVEPTPAGRGLINPSIVSDGYVYAAGITYWYVAYQNFSTSTPTNNPVRAAFSPDWGSTWTATVARTGFNDYDVSIDYNTFIGVTDSIYVLLSNNLTLSNPNLRFRKVALGNFTGTWSQFNPANTADPEYYGHFVVNRQNNQMVCGFTKVQGGIENIAYVYGTPGGTYFNATSPIIVSPQANNQTMINLNCQESQGAYRMSYHSQTPSFDTIIYKSTFDPVSFAGHQIVNATNDASPSVASSVAGFRSGTAFGGGVAFAGFGPSDIWYDASNIIPTSVSQNNTSIPSEYRLSQNYPNPFNPVTTINFSIPKGGLVKLTIYDIMGREVKTLINTSMEAGDYDYSLDASDMGSGVYFYKLISGSFSETKKMMVLK